MRDGLTRFAVRPGGGAEWWLVPVGGLVVVVRLGGEQPAGVERLLGGAR